MPILRGGVVLSSEDGPPETSIQAESPLPSPTPTTSVHGVNFYTPGPVGLWPIESPVAGPSTSETPRARRVFRNSPLPPSSPVLSSPDASPTRPATPSPLPPLSSDGLIYTSPIVGSKAERKSKSYAKGQKKRQATLANRVVSAEEQKHAVFDGILHQLTDNGLTFGDLMLYVFNPIYKQGETRWQGFFRSRGLATSILGFWVAPENSQTAREEVTEWAGDFVANLAQEAAQDITSSKYLQSAEAVVDGKFVDTFSMTTLHTYLQKHAKTVMKVLDSFATSARNLRKDISSRVSKRATIVTSAALALLGEYSHKNNFSRRIMALYLYAAGAQRQTISVMAHLGISESYQNLTRKPRFTITRRTKTLLAAQIEGLRTIRLGTLRQLSSAMRDMARSVAATGLYAASYDNINMVFQASEQVVGKNDSQENGTCATIWPLWKAVLEDMSINELNTAFGAAAPLSIKDILLSAPELQLMDKCLRHCILRIIIEHGGEKFERFRDALNKALPVTPEQIEVHQTPLHPVPAWNIDQSTIIGNDEFVDTFHTELRVKGLSHWAWIVKFFAGDQLSIARLRSLLNIRVGHEGGYSGYGWGVWIPGLFHAKIADMHGFFVTHWGVPNRGTRNPGSLLFHNTHLHRTPILLSSLPPFRTCRDLVFISLYARVLHCLLLETGTTTLDECADSIKTFADLEAHAAAIQKKYANSELVSDLRWKRKMADPSSGEVPGDEIFENASLLLRDALVSREFTDSVKAGDSGRIILVLKLLACSYRGNGRTKYAYEMLHLIHNLTKVWPESIRKIVLNNWLVNPTGNPFSWVEVDLMQEHMNFWIKTIYQAHGSSASWEWLEMVSPCISILRRLATMIKKTLGSDQGNKHQPADLKDDIALLMTSLREHDVYQIRGRVFAKDDGAPTPDVILVGAQQLTDSSSNPLTEYNTAFKRLQARRRLQPLVSGWSELTPSSTSIPESDLLSTPTNPIPTTSSPKPTDDLTPEFPASVLAEHVDSDEDDDMYDDFDFDDQQAAEALSAFEQALDEEDGSTLTRDTAADVALDMDGGDDGFLFTEADSDNPYLDDGEIDNSDDDYVDE
ncbi:hypothetical protein B0H10DRAFT_1795323 [Mycena sp. CBHHK59/15]|nr:hypothetical protein B0H10DRAFT_1795323 [Mycena sp. CBHHK59/15]